MHRQLVALLPAPGDCELSGQLVQKRAPSAEYVSAPQGRQVASEEAPTAAENLPAAQARHVEASEAPVASENLPPSHSEHEALPVVGLYVPAWHAAHSAGLGGPSW